MNSLLQRGGAIMAEVMMATNLVVPSVPAPEKPVAPPAVAEDLPRYTPSAFSPDLRRGACAIGDPEKKMSGGADVFEDRSNGGGNIAAARFCVGQMTRGTVYIINYPGVPSEVVSTVAEQVEIEVRLATGGLLTPKVVQAEASPLAVAKLADAVGQKGCVDTDKQWEYPSVIADVAMPLLDENSNKLALSSERACEEALAGIANGDREHAEGFYKSGYDTQEFVRVVVHEFLHGWLGHEAQLVSRSGRSLEDFIVDGKLNLADYLADSDYREYAKNTSVMGDTWSLNSVGQLDPIHLEIMRTPYVDIGLQESRVSHISGDWSSLSVESAKQGHFFTTRLATPIQLKDLTLPKGSIWDQEKTFNRLVFRPVVRGKSYNPYIDSIEVYLVGAGRSHDIASLGTIQMKGDLTISYDSDSFGLRMGSQDSPDLQVRRFMEGLK